LRLGFVDLFHEFKIVTQSFYNKNSKKIGGEREGEREEEREEEREVEREGVCFTKTLLGSARYLNNFSFQFKTYFHLI
jgi:hypothetical protein